MVCGKINNRLSYCFSYFIVFHQLTNCNAFFLFHRYEFSSVLSAISGIDARKADVTVETDRVNIFGAIEQLPGGFDGLNKCVIVC